jgi:predicted transcriptional regulator
MIVANKRTENEIMLDIWHAYGSLSPECVHMDGEATRAQANSNYRRATTRLRTLEKELGRKVSEDESFSWWMANKDNLCNTSV